MGAQINGLHRKLLICKESENRTSRFPWSKKAMDGLFMTSSSLRHPEDTKSHDEHDRQQ